MLLQLNHSISRAQYSQNTTVPVVISFIYFFVVLLDVMISSEECQKCVAGTPSNNVFFTISCKSSKHDSLFILIYCTDNFQLLINLEKYGFKVTHTNNLIPNTIDAASMRRTFETTPINFLPAIPETNLPKLRTTAEARIQ